VVARKRLPSNASGLAAASNAAAARSTPIHGRGGDVTDGRDDAIGRSSDAAAGRGCDVTDGPPQPGPQAHPGVRLSHTRQAVEHCETTRLGSSTYHTYRFIL
jgi:hypothetical protein